MFADESCIVTRPRTSPSPMPSSLGRVTYGMMEAAVDLTLVSRLDLGSGAVAMRYVPKGRRQD
jgi:hypothetical protein